MARILFVDDDPDFTSAVQALLKDEGHAVSIASGLSEARTIVESERFDIQFVDLMLPDGSGLELVTEDGPNTVIITGHPSIESAVRAIRGPVVDYLVKPVDERALLNAIARALSDTSGRFRVADGSRTTNNQTNDQIIGDSACMRALRETIREYGATDITVLITGESGTGKELVARALHRAWDPSRPFAAVNCGAIPQELLASELFGHEKGSFTGATARRKGLFERAEGGIVFLDEIGELPQQQQIALLRVLETRTIQRVGAEKEIPVSAHVVAATNRNLETQVVEGAFREDLFYRINVLTIHVPPLRERGGDVEQLATHYLAQYAAQYSTPDSASAKALARLGAYHWPGNVRELKHTLLRAALLNRGRARVEKLPDDFERPPGWTGHGDAMVPGMSIREVEKSLIEKTLDHFSGDKKMAADALGVSVKTLYNRLKDYETSPPEG